MTTIVALLILGGLIWLLFGHSIKASREEAERKQHEERIQKVRSLRDKYPDAYREWFGNSFYFSSMTDAEINKRLSISLYDWQSKQKSIENQREQERQLKQQELEKQKREQERKAQRIRQANEICIRFPNATKKRFGFNKVYTDMYADKVLATSIYELQLEETEILDEKRRRLAEIDEKYNKITVEYPNGLRIFKETHPTFTTKEQLSAISLDVYQEFEESYHIAQYYFNWYEAQTLFSKEVRHLKNSKLEKWGCFPYKAPVNGWDQYGKTKVYDFLIWQFFSYSFCASQTIDYSYYPVAKRNYELIEQIKNKKLQLYDNMYDQILDFILSIPGTPLVNILDSGLGDIWSEIEEYHFGYLRQGLRDHDIPFVSLTQLPPSEKMHKGPVVFIELISNNKRLRDTCSHFLMSSSGDNLTVTYITLLKEYDEEEMLEIIKRKETEIKDQKEKEHLLLIEEEKKKKEEEERLAREKEEREKQEQINQQILSKAKHMISAYAEAVSQKFGYLSPYSLTLETAKRICENESSLREKQKQIDSEKEYNQRIQKATREWEVISGIPLYYFYWYYPTRYTDISTASQNVRRLIYNFKDGKDHSGVAKIIQNKLLSTFSKEDIQSFTFVCIPASTISVNNSRYASFSNEVCEALGMRNGFPHVHITRERMAAHLGGTDTAEYSFDEPFFKGAKIILFDDIVTKGGSMRQFKSYMEKCGATIVCGLSIGRTYSDYYGDNRKPHPWIGVL